MDELKTMSMEEWCGFSYRVCHLGDPGARLQLARLYKRCPHVKDNMRYALFWLVMAHESHLQGGGRDAALGRELSDEISAVSGDLADREVEHVVGKAKYASEHSLGVSNQSAPSSGEAFEFRDGMCQY